MFDFRYHALSLAAVLLALCMGLLLGVAIGDRGLASSAQESLRSDLRAEVEQARAETREMRARLEDRDRFEEQALPVLVDDRMAGRRVSVVLLGETDMRTFEHVRDVVREAGGEVSSVARLDFPLDLERVSLAASGTRYERLDEDPELLAPFGRRVGEQLVTGGRFLQAIRGSLFASSSGAMDGADAIVLARSDSDGEDDGSLEREEVLVESLIEGARQYDTSVVGVELTETEPSQVPWYQERDLTSVDSVDLPSGRAALVFALIGAADGAYGVKPSRDALLPEAVTRRP